MNTYSKLRHLPCNMNDFNADCHRFSFEINGKKGEARCFSKGTVYFTVGLMPDVERQLTSAIWNKIDKDELKWSYPAEAYEIANQYCAEEFR